MSHADMMVIAWISEPILVRLWMLVSTTFRFAQRWHVALACRYGAVLHVIY